MARIYISLGTNVEREYHTQQGLDALQQAFGRLILSPLYESEAVGFDGNAFYNMVIGADTQRSLKQVCVLLKQIEADNGRVHGDKKFAPRTLDLDLLLYDTLITDHPTQLPRGEILYNAFVLRPLAEVAPDRIHPEVERSYAELWQDYDRPQKLWPVTLNWTPNGSD
ncbi:2-amino-4-hydroxy-6-hydroxymethyldihydropteridine diphosphokinase [Saliniradius amylolyticus]|uniref:2-amino-4-hydroxy-6-hydroxymethyldihydropteridine diphosphokinase n=1 Tax=Saliniradius amylolyticus TaxID=2183582 RepID=A0A2S2E0D0_9ALTE|nr:2-amino-4-hydroxy-6-hydroxymethyldihydropteridine diphosphokinase [Saliniradius amylolyticus]AWL11098.1 2-amino-4-hydroxy-6-hydroxymethyldihydropteridine diphosphokinase [Saliniradius amylolyticus]